MTTLHRFIFRMDFERCYRIADSTGEIMQIMSESSDNFWDEIGAKTNQVNAVRHRVKTEQHISNISVDLQSISGSIEMSPGEPFNEFFESAYLDKIDRIITKLVERFRLNALRRFGSRYLITAGTADDFESNSKRAAEAYSSFFIPSRLSSRGNLELDDVSVNLHGSFDHEIKFRLLSGPADKGDVSSFFSSIILNDEEVASRAPHKYSADIDIFQENINFKGTTLLRWVKAKRTNINHLLEIAENTAKSDK